MDQATWSYVVGGIGSPTFLKNTYTYGGKIFLPLKSAYILFTSQSVDEFIVTYILFRLPQYTIQDWAIQITMLTAIGLFVMAFNYDRNTPTAMKYRNN